MKEGDGSFHGRFDRMEEPAETKLIRYFEKAEILNKLQDQDVREKRVARNFLRMTRRNAHP